MVFQKRRRNIKPIDVVKICYFRSKGLILLRPPYKSPPPAFSTISKHIYGKNIFDFMCRAKVVITVVDINDNEGSFTPYVNGEEENPRVTFPPGKDFAGNAVRRGTIVLRVEIFGFHFNNNPFGIVVSEDFFP